MRYLASCVVSMLCSALLFVGCSGGGDRGSAMPEGAHVMAASWEEAGKYLVQIGGCNDCHTDNYLFSGGMVPESEWLLGSSMGWQGPWGTTYPSNLRIFIQETPEPVFLALARTRNERPPMPWWALHEMSENDLKSIYRYIASLPVKGQKAPEFVPPEGNVLTPALRLVPRLPDGTELTGPSPGMDSPN